MKHIYFVLSYKFVKSISLLIKDLLQAFELSTNLATNLNYNFQHFPRKRNSALRVYKLFLLLTLKVTFKEKKISDWYM